ncbi:hypothetical protein SDC9_51311 [bioreactor metagenome]|uniref:Uncharacterized protein n=1 Tax=bioreactor metagenome TaxID=1076179 RepID=A0A644WML3_9ZZZZ
MDNNQEEQIIKRVITGKEMLERKIKMLENEKAYSESLGLYTIEELSSINKRINDCQYFSEAREIENLLRTHSIRLKKIVPRHNITSIESASYKSDELFKEKFNKDLSDRIKWFDDAMVRLGEKIASGKLKKAPELKSLELHRLSDDYIKDLHRYLISEEVIKDEGQKTYESLVYALTGRKLKDNWVYEPLTLLAPKKDLGFILSYLINGNQLGMLSNEIKRLAGNLFINDNGASIGPINNLSKQDKEWAAKRDKYREFFTNTST